MPAAMHVCITQGRRMTDIRTEAARIAGIRSLPVELVEQQLTLEQESLTAGVERYRKLQQDQGEVATQPGMKLLKATIGPLKEAIENYIEETKAGRPVRGAAVVVKFLDQYPADAAAYITARYVLNSMSKGLSLQAVALALAKALEDALSHDHLQKENPGLYRQLLRKIEKSSDERYRHVLLRRQQKYAGIETVPWSTKHRLQLGELLIHLMAESTGMVRIVNTMGGGTKSQYMVLPTEATMEWLEKAHARSELFAPIFLPMIVPPKRWKGPYGGGYIGKHLRYALVKTANKNYLEELRAWDMPKVYAAINALQETAWSINGAVLNVLRQVWDGGGNLGGLPPRDTLPLPAKTFAEDAASDDAAVVAWRKEAAMVYSENVRLVSKRVAMILQAGDRGEASRSSSAEFFFPHAMDWRGRAYRRRARYAQAAGRRLRVRRCSTSPRAKPLGHNGAFWLAVHGAN
jgi:DNA-directed RNA polymerase